MRIIHRVPCLDDRSMEEQSFSNNDPVCLLRSGCSPRSESPTSSHTSFESSVLTFRMYIYSSVHNPLEYTHLSCGHTGAGCGYFIPFDDVKG
ncbi:hypothetical protein VTL71DRAFT_3842 [Oculimacula yallundae]|uniref:Uncharacterized protein n=1 Tax=Oculimacula yallundae TaxID=86028 RepID=A0ABR4C471_9HELO